MGSFLRLVQQTALAEQHIKRAQQHVAEEIQFFHALAHIREMCLTYAPLGSYGFTMRELENNGKDFSETTTQMRLVLYLRKALRGFTVVLVGSQSCSPFINISWPVVV